MIERDFENPKTEILWLRVSPKDRQTLERIAGRDRKIASVVRELISRFAPVLEHEAEAKAAQ